MTSTHVRLALAAVLAAWVQLAAAGDELAGLRDGRDVRNTRILAKLAELSAGLPEGVEIVPAGVLRIMELQEQGYTVRGACASPITGAEGNREFFLHLAPQGPPLGDDEVEELVRKAVEE